LNLPAIDIILPCYNPANGWVNNIVAAYEELKLQLPSTNIHLILVNDGSSKGISTNLIDALKKQIPSLQYIEYAQNRGKGYALRQGVAAAQAPFCIYTDVDFPYTTSSIIKIIQTLVVNKSDIAAGVKDANYYHHVPAFRRFISKLLRKSTASILRLKVADTQCGLKGFNEAGKKVFLETTIDRYLFDLEFVYLASGNNNINIVPVEIELKPNVLFSSMRAGVLFTEARNFIKILFKKR
jgi:glycosyltransferase involved in cell wall biosynthesis